MSRQSASRLCLYLLRIITVTITYYGDATSFTFCRACAKGGRVIVIFLIQHSSRVLADGGNVFLRKPIRARVFASTPVHLAGRGDGAWETTTAFRSRRRVPGDGARSPACGEAKERRGAGWWEASSFPSEPRRSRGTEHRRGDRQGNFPPCKALKTHKMRKESRFCASRFHGPAERSPLRSPGSRRARA
jgi:hypothetical protein